MLVAGDLHSVLWDAETIIAQARSEDCPLILQVGDLNYQPTTRRGADFLTVLDQRLVEVASSWRFCDGNHDLHAALDQLAAGCCDPVRAGTAITYLPRGARWTWRGVRFLAVGGAASIAPREPDPDVEPFSSFGGGPSHWPAELISEANIRHSTAGGVADVLVSHDMPYIPRFDAFELWDDPTSTANRVQLRRIVEATRPLLVVHGHYHRRHQTQTSVRGGQPVTVIGLPDARAGARRHARAAPRSARRARTRSPKLAS